MIMNNDKVEMRLEGIFLRINPKQFHFLKFILEGYDGLALLSSHDIKSGIVVVRFPKIMRKEVIELLGELARRLSPFPNYFD